ncbi:MAG: hypothetical protein AB7O26_04585, partial [Planctomycetaceae bacterium]
ADLEKLLNKRRSVLDALTSRRDKLQKDLEKVERRIVSLEGRSGAAGSLKARRKRPKNSQSLAAVVEEVLSRSKNGLPLAELSEKVLATGYKSGSSNFKNVLYQCLYNSPNFVHDSESGNYKLKRTAK